jgi:hypothetical protein
MNNGLGAFVLLVPASGKVGATITILGNNLSSTSGVSFNGTPAAFTAESDFYLTAVVPSGATDGTVTVSLPSATIESNKSFTVAP